MFELIKDFREFLRLRKRRKIAVKKFMIRRRIEKFYEDLEKANGEELSIPAWQITSQLMRDCIKTDADVNRVYKNMEELCKVTNEQRKNMKEQEKMQGALVSQKL